MSKEELLKFVSEAVRRGYMVFAPIKQEGLALLARVEDTASIDFDHVLTVNTVKDILLPRCESLAAFDLEERSITATSDDPDRILIFGTRPCDAAGVTILDPILLGRIRDARYARRREQTVIVTLACSESDDACFCGSMGYGPHDATGSDVLILPLQDQFIVRSVTAKGETFLGEMGLKETQGGAPDSPPELPREIETGQLKAWLDQNFESPKWHTVSENCVSCGTCYYLCPTCHCFDIVDEAGLSRGERLRIWDCCSFANFTKMASHQPRVGKHARYRQRVMHKFKYCVDNVNEVACVGDGRCVRYCPYGVDVCEILEILVRER
jgi:sulfhydrogenase subunit beta (sulfur reductase)